MLKKDINLILVFIYLDWDTDDFYASRKDVIDQRLLQISSKNYKFWRNYSIINAVWKKQEVVNRNDKANKNAGKFL